MSSAKEKGIRKITEFVIGTLYFQAVAKSYHEWFIEFSKENFTEDMNAFAEKINEHLRHKKYILR